MYFDNDEDDTYGSLFIPQDDDNDDINNNQNCIIMPKSRINEIKRCKALKRKWLSSNPISITTRKDLKRYKSPLPVYNSTYSAEVGLPTKRNMVTDNQSEIDNILERHVNHSDDGEPKSPYLYSHGVLHSDIQNLIMSKTPTKTIV